jgi:hypothetical protein
MRLSSREWMADVATVRFRMLAMTSSGLPGQYQVNVNELDID